MKILSYLLSICFGVTVALGDQVATPVLEPQSGMSATQFSVSITCATPNALIRYTTNGTEPTISSASIASGANVAIGRNLTLKAKAWDGNVPATLDASNTVSASYSVVGAVGAGAGTSLSLSFNEKLRVWGRNDDGRLGLGTTANQLSPALASEGVISMDGSAEDASGLGHTVWAKNDGTVWAAGNNSAGQLGDNSTTTPGDSLPVQVERQSAAPLTGVLMVAAGKSSSYALTSDGSVYAWGENGSAKRLGDGGTTSRAYADVVKTAASTPLAGVIAVASGNDHVIALKSDGNVWAWGGNGAGQIGNNGTTAQGYAVQVQAGASNPSDPSQPLAGIVAIAAGEAHSLAVASDGTVYGWGEAALGRLGEGTTGASSNPILRPITVLASASTAFSDAIGVAAGAKFSLILKEDGTLWACGDNSSGQLGDGTTSDRSYPRQVSMTATTYLADIVDMAGGANHALVLTTRS